MTPDESTIRQVMAHLGRKGGSVKSERKAAAASRNGLATRFKRKEAPMPTTNTNAQPEKSS